MAYVPDSGSVLAFQGTVPWSVIGVNGQSVSGTVNVGNFPTNQSVSGSVGLVGNPSISGTVLVNNGSVVAFQGGAPWANVIVGSVISYSQGSIAAVIVGGSVASAGVANQSVSGTVVATQLAGSILATSATFNPPANQSVSGTVGASIIGAVPVTGTVFVAGSVAAILAGSVNQSVSGTIGASTIGTVPVTQVTNPWIVTSSIAGGIFPISGSVAAIVTNNVTVVSSLAGGIFPVSGSVSAVITNSPTVIVNNGSVVAFQGGIQVTSLVSTIPSSVLVGASIFGQLPAGTAMIGSVAAFQAGTVPWLQTFSNSSIIAVNAGSVVALSQGSVITVFQNSSLFSAQQGTWKTSIASNYASNSASIISAIGNLGLAVRNNGMASVLANADGSYGPVAMGAWGDQIVSFAPQPAWTSGIGSCFTGVEQPIITSVAGQYVNVTGVQVANASANNVYVSFYGSGVGSVTGSIIGFTVAPANGGSNIPFPIPLRTAIGSPFSASISGVASVYLSAQGFYSKS